MLMEGCGSGSVQTMTDPNTEHCKMNEFKFASELSFAQTLTSNFCLSWF
jgi:hypothetical protein